MTEEDMVYLCHPTYDFNVKFEAKCIKDIQNEFGFVRLLNPRTDIILSEEDKKKLSGEKDGYIEMLNKHYLPAIDRCNIVAVFSSDYQNYPDGVFREVEYAKYRGKTVIEGWQLDRRKFYSESGVIKYLDNYFDVQKGIRCVVGHEKDLYRLKHEPSYRKWNGSKCRSYTLPDIFTGKYTSLLEYWCNHSYMYTFNKSVLDWNDEVNSIGMFTENMVGLNPVIELDSPDDPGSDKARRLTFFDYVKEYQVAIDRIVKILEEYTTDYNLQFSGNGIYICLEGYYGNDLLEEGCFSDNFSNILDILKEREGLDNKMKVHVCNSQAPWNKYFKIPFTFHETRPRVSIPLSANELDKEWIDRVSNVNNIMNDYSIVDEVIKKSAWKKLW
jgi:hypothetical protein